MFLLQKFVNAICYLIWWRLAIFQGLMIFVCAEIIGAAAVTPVMTAGFGYPDEGITFLHRWLWLFVHQALCFWVVCRGYLMWKESR